MFIHLRMRRITPFLILLAIAVSVLLFLDAADVFVAADSLVEPQRVLIIDAGHGGEDGGSQSASGTLESEINLSIALKLEAIAGLYGIPTAMTRTTQDIDYPDSARSTAARKRADQKARVELINSYPDAILISIHQNAFPDRRPSGSQVLYAKTEGSEALGKLTHEMLLKWLCPDNRRVAAPISEKIYLMKSVNCTAILVECGFLSNVNEAALLQDDMYQIKLSALMFASYMQYIEQADRMET